MNGDRRLRVLFLWVIYAYHWIGAWRITHGFAIHSPPISRRLEQRFGAVEGPDADGADDSEDLEDIHGYDSETLGLSSSIPSNPFDVSSRLSKSDLYDDDELLNLLHVHSQLTGNTGASISNGGSSSSTSPKPETSSSNRESTMGELLHEAIMKSYGGDTMQRLLDLHDSLEEVRRSDVEFTSDATLHKQIVQAVGDIQDNAEVAPQRNFDWLDNATVDTIVNRISAIASDVDGTILTSKQTIHPRTKKALLRALEQSRSGDGKIRHFFPATGKSRKGAFQSLGPDIAELLQRTPGVFLQGLYCIDAKGNVLFERKLQSGAIEMASRLASESNISMVAYDGDDLYTTEMTDIVRDLTDRYGEPRPSCLAAFVDHQPGMHKLLYLDEDVERLNQEIRPKLEAVAAEHGATVTQAMSTMLELLPEGCSKALGVEKVCKALHLDASTQLLAIGDAENDVGMLDMAAIGVAVGNACPVAKEASDFFLEESNDDGGAGVAMEVFGFGDGIR